jgi:integrase
VKALTLEEIERLMASITEPCLRAMCEYGFRHGARSSEICGLLRADLDMQNRTVTVRRLKNSLTTVQPLGEAEHKALAEWLAVAPASLYVFPNAMGGRLHRSTFWRWFRSAATLAGLPADKRHGHVLKHSLAYQLVRGGVNLAIVQQALGHRSISSTAVYTRVTDEDAGRAVANVLGGKMQC